MDQKENAVELSKLQIIRLRNVWFVYGNGGSKHTHYNHRFIQNLIEKGEDDREFYLNPENKEKQIKRGSDWAMLELTQECLDKVDAILKWDGNG